MRHADRVKLLCGIAVVAAITVSAAPALAQTNPDPNSAPNPYRLDEGWAKQPMGRGFGSTIGLNVDRDGKSMWIYDRCGGNTCENSKIAPLNKYDASGKVVASIGAGLIDRPHGHDASAGRLEARSLGIIRQPRPVQRRRPQRLDAQASVVGQGVAEASEVVGTLFVEIDRLDVELVQEREAAKAVGPFDRDGGLAEVGEGPVEERAVFGLGIASAEADLRVIDGAFRARNSACLLGVSTHHEPVDVLEKEDRQSALIAIHDEASGLVGAVHIDDAAVLERPLRRPAALMLIGHHADRSAANPGESRYDRAAVFLAKFVERARVYDTRQQIPCFVLAVAVRRNR